MSLLSGREWPHAAMKGSGLEPVTHPGLTLHSRELFRQGAVVQIRHQGQIYQLRLTRQDKLILTK